MAGFGLGVDVAPINLLPGQSLQPTGPALIDLLVRDHLTQVRLLDSPPAPDIAQAQALAAGGWKTVFGELQHAGIRAVLLLSGAYRADGAPAGGTWAPEGPPGASASPVGSMPTATWIADEKAVLTQIRSQNGGSFPPALAGIEVANEPTVDPSTIPDLAQAIAAAHAEAPGIPVTIGGWRAPKTKGQGFLYNDPSTAPAVVPLVDFVSAHLYPDNAVPSRQHPDRSSTDPSAFAAYARSFLQALVADAKGKPVFVGEFGGRSGLGGGPAASQGGSPAHQQAVVQAVADVLVSEADHGLTGGTAWWLEPALGTHTTCDSFALICLDANGAQPALRTLALIANSAPDK